MFTNVKKGGIAVEFDRRRLKPTMVALRLLALDFIHDYIAEWRDSPSLGEIAAALSIDRKTAHKAVLSLAASGLIIRAAGVRGIMLPDQRDQAVRVLRSMGWDVNPDVCLATNRPLMVGPAIDYMPVPTQGGMNGQGHGRAEETVNIAA